MIKVFLSISLILIAFSSSQAESLLQVDESGKLQATLQNVSLQELKPFFEENYGIKFIGEDNLFQTQVTVTFNKLSLEKTLKRIFSKMNVVFRYSNQGSITEVRLLPSSQNQTRAVIPNKLIKDEEQQVTIQQNQEPLQENNAVQEDMQNSDDPTVLQVEPSSPPNLSIEGDPNDDITSFEIEVNSPPSGDSFQIVPSPPPSFK